jgi:hypothetical protein
MTVVSASGPTGPKHNTLGARCAPSQLPHVAWAQRDPIDTGTDSRQRIGYSVSYGWDRPDDEAFAYAPRATSGTDRSRVDVLKAPDFVYPGASRYPRSAAFTCYLPETSL